MPQAQARTSFDAYLDAPRRADRSHLRIVEDLREEAPGIRIPDADPAIESPDWAAPFLDARWADALRGATEVEIRDGRRTVLVTGRPGAQHLPRRDRTPGATARQRRHTP